MIARLLQDRRGGTAIEYAMIAACLALLILTAVGSIGLQVEGMFADVGKGFEGVTP